MTDQQQAANLIVEELEGFGDIGEVSPILLLDALAVAGLKLEEGNGEASAAFFKELQGA